MENNYFVEEDHFKNDLKRIKDVFNTSLLLKQKMDNVKIKNYYKYSSFAYHLFHSKEGSVHLAINYDGVFNPEGHSKQAREIGNFIKNKDNVLELGCGKGFNSILLAEKYKSSKFYGIDISKTQLNYAKRKEKNFHNLKFYRGDFQNLSHFHSNSFDLIFGVEALCYAENVDTLLKEVNRVLKKGGKFIIYDAFRVSTLQNNFEKENISLCEKAMAVNQFHLISYWLNMAQSNCFKIDINNDISYAIMPNLKRLYRGSKKYLKNKILAKIILFSLPSYVVKNAISGILMPYNVMRGTLRYHKIIMTKTCNNDESKV